MSIFRSGLDDTPEIVNRATERLWKKRDVSEAERTDRALAVALKYGRNGDDSLALRDYKGASVNLANHNWLGSYRSADAEQINALPIMRARGRDIEQNNPYGERYLSELEANVLGPEGMTLQMQIQEWDPNFEGEPTAILGPDGSPVKKKGAWVPDEAANDKIENGWHDWKKQGNCDVSGELSYHECERLALRSCARDGDCMVRFVRDWDGNEYGFALQLIEGDALDHNYSTVLPNGNIVVMGVEMDAWRRRVAYHILTRHPGDYFTPRNPSGEYRERVLAREIIHLRFLRRIGQTRGVSWFSPVMDLMEMLRGYEEAELISARSEACKGGFFYSDIVPEGGFAGKIPNPQDLPRMQMTPAEMRRLPYGVKYQPVNPTHPNGNYQSYREGVLRGIASGLSVSYNILANDLKGVSYSSLRGGLLDEREIYKMLQAWFTTRFEMLVFQAWLEMAMIRRKIQLPFFKFDKFNAPYFQGRRWDWVDPVKDIEAIERAIEAGLTSRRAEVAKKGGYIVDIAKEQRADKDLEKRYGLKWGSVQATSSTQPDEPDPDKTGSEAEDTPIAPPASQDTDPE